MDGWMTGWMDEYYDNDESMRRMIIIMSMMNDEYGDR